MPTSTLQRPPHFRFRFERDGESFRVQADDNEFVMELPIEWAFGAGDHGITFVSRLNQRAYIEHAFSYYSGAGTLDITTGHETIRPRTLHQAIGLLYKVRGPGQAIADCFQCHSTGPLSFSEEQQITVNEKGVRCEACHGPGSAHLDAVGRGDVAAAKEAIQNPAHLSASELNQFCGRCHRKPMAGAAGFDWETAWNIRHQPPYFEQSSCFQRSAGELSCFTCHDPHEPVRRNDPDHYRARCVNCHRESNKPPREVCETEPSPDCTQCHMPTVAVSSHLEFRNHWIGVYADGAPLKPSR